MRQLIEHRPQPRIGRALAIAAALLCATAFSQPNLAYAGPHGGGGGFHGGGGGFHGGGVHAGGFHGGGSHGGGFGGFHGRFAGMHNGFRERHEGFRERHEGFRDRRDGFIGGLGFGYYGYPYGWDYSPDYGYSQPYTSQVWYYCSDPAGYYPYVTQCNTGWQTVPAS
jgi:hypothetical protein